MPSSRIIKFSENNRKGLLSVPVDSDNDLVLGLIYGALKNEVFDYDDKNFKNILRELMEEYADLKNKILKTPKEIPQELIKLITYAGLILNNIFKELHANNINEEVMSENLANLLNNTNKIYKEYRLIIRELKHKDTILEKIRNWSGIRKFLVTTAVVSTIGGGTMIAGTPHKGILNAPNKNTIVKENVKSTIPAKTKVLTAKEIVERIELEKIEKLKNEYKQVKKEREQIIVKVKKILSKLKMPANYIQPKHIMALMWAESRFNPDAMNGDDVKGIMQVNDKSVSMDLEKNIMRGLEILKEKEIYCRINWNKDHINPKWDELRADKKIQIVFAAYNCGQSRLDSKYNWKVRDSNDETESHDQAIWDYINHLY